MKSKDGDRDSGTELDRLLEQFDRGGRDFERLVRWFLLNDPEYASQFASVWLWNDWPGRWGRDKGIDLVAETHDGCIVAVQAKNYDPGYWITKGDIDTFLSESSRAAIHERLLVATTDKVAANAREVMAGQQKPVSRCLRSRLQEAAVNWPNSPSDLRSSGAVEAKTPEPHQHEALKAIADGLRVADRGQVIMACGTGKSLIGLWAAEQSKADRVLVLVPTLRLLRQTVQVWAANAATEFRALKVCSDTAAPADEELGVLDVGDMGGGVTTDPKRIQQFLRGDGRRVLFSTYQSSPQVARAVSEGQDPFDLAICDEAHWCAGEEGRSNKTILDNQKLPCVKRLFFTATPVLYRPADVNVLARRQVRVASMSNPRLFGHVLYRLSFAAAIDRGLLCPYQVVVIPVTDHEVEQLIERRAAVTTDGGDTHIDAYSLATQIACARAMRDYDCERMVSFHPRIEHSRAFSEGFQRAVELLAREERPHGRVWAAHVDGDRMPRGKRDQLLAAFAAPPDGSRRLLSNVKLLTEGVDVPGIDSITLIDTQRGPTQIIQMIGRAVRRAPGKTVGTIVLPVLVRGDESLEAALARSDHRPIMHLLSALRAADPDIERSLNDLRVEVDPDTGKPPAVRRFILGVPREVGREFADAVDVMLVDTLAPSKKPLRAPRTSDRASDAPQPQVISFQEPEWSDPATTQRGLAVLDSYRRFGVMTPMVGGVPTWVIFEEFPLGRWWHALLTSWDDQFPDAASKQSIADLITWLSLDPKRHLAVRRELQNLTTQDLVSHIDSWISVYGTAPDELVELCQAGAIGDMALLQTDRIRKALCHAKMPLEEQVRVIRKALLIAGDESTRRAQPHCFAQGFMDALHEAPRSNPTMAEAGDRGHQGMVEQYAAGWELAVPFFDEVLAARRIRDGGGGQQRRPRRRGSRSAPGTPANAPRDARRK